jgi:hypothetical protein
VPALGAFEEHRLAFIHTAHLHLEREREERKAERDKKHSVATKSEAERRTSTSLIFPLLWLALCLYGMLV